MLRLPALRGIHNRQIASNYKGNVPTCVNLQDADAKTNMRPETGYEFLTFVSDLGARDRSLTLSRLSEVGSLWLHVHTLQTDADVIVRYIENFPTWYIIHQCPSDLSRFGLVSICIQITRDHATSLAGKIFPCVIALVLN